jgi:hypothetical protein
MISLTTARRLKAAGLDWQPRLNDYFAIPDRGMDDRVFVLADMLATLEFLRGRQVVAFQGASEWALDNLVLEEVVWMPREDQLRLFLESALIETGRPELRLVGGLSGYTLTIMIDGETFSFSGRPAEEAYAAALLYLLQPLQ